MARSRKKLGQILVAQGAINAEQADQGLKHAKETGKRLGEALIDLGTLDEMEVVKALAAQYGMKYVDLSNERIAKLIDDEALDKTVMKKHLVLALGKSGGKMRLAIHDPMDLEMLDNLRFRLNMDVEPMLATKTQIRNYLDSGNAGTPAAAPGVSNAPSMTDGESLVTDSIDRSIDRSLDRSMDRSIDVSSEDSPVVKLVNRILEEAVNNRTSDIHLEPMADRVRLRYRIDGVCIERDNLPKRMQNAILSRLKLMSGMNIAERRVPQDGRIKIYVDEVGIDFRVSACPA